MKECGAQWRERREPACGNPPVPLSLTPTRNLTLLSFGGILLSIVLVAFEKVLPASTSRSGLGPCDSARTVLSFATRAWRSAIVGNEWGLLSECRVSPSVGRSEAKRSG